MHLTKILCKQHIGWHFKQMWKVQGKRVIRSTRAMEEMAKRGIDVIDANDYVKEAKKPPVPFTVIGAYPKPIKYDETHPDWKNEACYSFEDNNLLLKGTQQAQALTNTVEIKNLPNQLSEIVKSQSLPDDVGRKVQNCIMESLVFDAEQVILPRLKDEERPQIKLPRAYGISLARGFNLLTDRLIFECERSTSSSLNKERRVLTNVAFKSMITRGQDLIQLPTIVEKMVFSTNPIRPIKESFEGEVPDIYPLKCTINIPTKNIYKNNNTYPLSKSIKCSHPHTLFVKFDKHETGNLHGIESTEDQFMSRTMIKAFTVATARAKQLYGNAVSGPLPDPIALQCIQTDGQKFHFGVYQLNTLDLTGDSNVKNYWFNEPCKQFYNYCGYKQGKPQLIGYNSEVFRYINAFYNNS